MPPRRPSVLPSSSCLACVRLAAVAVSLAGSAAGATDLASASSPTTLADGAVSIGARTLHLPPGDWTLVERGWRQVGGRRAGGGVDVYASWIADVRAGELRSLVHLELPVRDAPGIGHPANMGCGQGANALRAAAQRAGGERDCVVTVADPDVAADLQRRAPEAAAWLAGHRVHGMEAAVRLAVRHRTDTGFGGIEIFLPTTRFASDDDAAQWAEQLRAAVAPLFAGSGGEATLPSLEPPVDAEPAGAASEPR